MMRQLLCIFAFLYCTSCAPCIGLFGCAPMVHVKPLEDCRVVETRGEGPGVWLLTAKGGAMILVSREQWNTVRVGQTVCGPWKDKEPEAQQQKFVPHHLCFWSDDQQCQQPNKA